MAAHILLVDDDQFMRESLLDSVRGLGHRGVVASSALEAIDIMGCQSFDLIITDLRMPGMSGLQFLEQVRKRDNKLPVILITANGTVETAVEAMKHGATDYILKPFGAEELEVMINKALNYTRLVGENEALRGELRQRDDRPLLGGSPEMDKVRERIAAIADADVTVLVRGETGTGKELVSRAIHYASRRADRPYLCVNCAALSAGLLESELFGHEKGAFTGADRQRAGRFELAKGGSLLLDEVSEIDLNLQAKLLRVLQEREFERVGSGKSIRSDVRVIATTNRKLEDAVKDGSFREDLYYRLNIVPIDIPPLRERKEDLLLLSESFKQKAEKRAGKPTRLFDPHSVAAMQAYHWPGNVRELENLIERAVLLSSGEFIQVSGLQAGGAPVSQSGDVSVFRGMALEEIERAMVEETLRMFDGHQKKTAASLGIGVRTLRDKIKKWDLNFGRRARREQEASIG